MYPKCTFITTLQTYTVWCTVTEIMVKVAGWNGTFDLTDEGKWWKVVIWVRWSLYVPQKYCIHNHVVSNDVWEQCWSILADFQWLVYLRLISWESEYKTQIRETFKPWSVNLMKLNILHSRWKHNQCCGIKYCWKLNEKMGLAFASDSEKLWHCSVALWWLAVEQLHYQYIVMWQSKT